MTDVLDTDDSRGWQVITRARAPPAAAAVSTPATYAGQLSVDLNQTQLPDEITDAVRNYLRIHPEFASPVDSCHISHRAPVEDRD